MKTGSAPTPAADPRGSNSTTLCHSLKSADARADTRRHSSARIPLGCHPRSNSKRIACSTLLSRGYHVHQQHWFELEPQRDHVYAPDAGANRVAAHAGSDCGAGFLHARRRLVLLTDDRDLRAAGRPQAPSWTSRRRRSLAAIGDLDAVRVAGTGIDFNLDFGFGNGLDVIPRCARNDAVVTLGSSQG